MNETESRAFPTPHNESIQLRPESQVLELIERFDSSELPSIDDGFEFRVAGSTLEVHSIDDKRFYWRGRSVRILGSINDNSGETYIASVIVKFPSFYGRALARLRGREPYAVMHQSIY